MERPNDKTIKDELAQIEEQEAEYLLAEIKAIIKNDKRVKGGKKMILESYSDYPSSVSNNAKRGLELKRSG